jgi:hypothetical protein
MSKGLSPATPATRDGRVDNISTPFSFGAANDRDLRQEYRVGKQRHAENQQSLPKEISLAAIPASDAENHIAEPSGGEQNLSSSSRIACARCSARLRPRDCRG